MPSLAKSALLLGCSPLWACVAPTDCSVEPERCLPPAYHVKSAPSKLKLQPLLPLVPLVPGLPIAVAPAGVPVADRLAQRGPNPQPERDHQVPVADQQLVVVRRALSAAMPALKAHDLQALRPFVTARYAKQFAEIEAQYKDRFWRHADRVGQVLGSAHPQFSIEPQPDGHLQATIKSPDGLEIRPVVVQEDGVWKLDRL